MYTLKKVNRNYKIYSVRKNTLIFLAFYLFFNEAEWHGGRRGDGVALVTNGKKILDNVFQSNCSSHAKILRIPSKISALQFKTIHVNHLLTLDLYKFEQNVYYPCTLQVKFYHRCMNLHVNNFFVNLPFIKIRD